jgi:WD40 repeat protein
LLTTLKGHRGRVVAIAISGDSKIIVSGSSDRTVKIWHRDRKHEFSTRLDKTLQGHTAGLMAIQSLLLAPITLSKSGAKIRMDFKTSPTKRLEVIPIEFGESRSHLMKILLLLQVGIKRLDFGS